MSDTAPPVEPGEFDPVHDNDEPDFEADEDYA